MIQPSDWDTEIFKPFYTSHLRNTAVGRVSHTRLDTSKSILSQIGVKTHFLSEEHQITNIPSSNGAFRSEKSEVNGGMVEGKPPVVEQLSEVAINAAPSKHNSKDISVAPESGGFGSDDKDSIVTDTESEDAKEPGLLPVLRNRNFLALWSGQVFSQLADKVYLVLMIALISTRFQTGNQSISGWVSAIMMAFTIPAVLLVRLRVCM